METREDNKDERSKGRQAITRRSCDQCRARKIGCDRASPCSHCTSARLSCTHSAVAPSSTPPKQRVLISAQYEQRIDDITKGIDDIKLLLRGLNVSPETNKSETVGSVGYYPPADSVRPLLNGSGNETTPWDHSVHIIDFIKAVVEDRGSRDTGPEASEVISPLRNLLEALENPTVGRDLFVPETNFVKHHTNVLMPPLEATVAVMRWAKDHQGYSRITWISGVLPLEKFTEICRKVYFAVDDYSEVDLIIANGYLSYIFSEHAITTGTQDYLEYCELCRKNFQTAISRLPLILPASMEVIAALMLGAFNAIESSKNTAAWTFISTASDLCQVLGYHRLCSSGNKGKPLRAAQERLFWTIYKFDKSLSLRLGRASSIQDSEITLQLDPNEPLPVRAARIQGKAYDQLYSPIGLSQDDEERGRRAEVLAGEIRTIIHETHAEIFDATMQSSYETDPMRVIYLRFEMVCQSSLLALILRASPTTQGDLSGLSEECSAAARDALDMHEQCIMSLYSFRDLPIMMTKYMSWGIVHMPFVPFNILFTRAVRLLDVAELARLDRFTASLRPEVSSSESIAQPHRLYELLCQAARLYIGPNTSPSHQNISLTPNLADSLAEFDLAQFGVEVGLPAEAEGPQGNDLSDWFYGNQQIMSLLDQDLTF